MYAINMDDFGFDFQLMIVPTIEIFSALFLMAIVTVTTIYYLNKRYSKENFIIFLVDAVDSGEFKNILLDNSEYMETFYDFTYYTDAASVFAFTRDSVPNILSGSINKNEKEYFEYCDEAYNNSMLFSMLDEQQYG